MEWTVEHDEELGFVTVRTRGVFTTRDHLRMTEDVLSRDFWRPGTSVLFDHRALEFGAADLAVMRAASENHVAHDDRIGTGKAAVLMKAAADFGRGRQFEMLSEGRISALVHIFLDEAEAIAWLLH
ncbi:hypothetical protein [Longimicrobium sp.]|uniref:hypothetical protein n=1 Tax=Longimicrobium sp. TaxID=2029185 RepID=UPI002E3286B7|nr:hypothetical protein [Longimicrobium sp.]HEX6038820.1 hypothetical protein [Longimicrobium sp.]